MSARISFVRELIRSIQAALSVRNS